MSDRSHRVEIFEAGSDPTTQAIMVLIAMAMKGGIREAGENVTIMVPAGIEMGFSEDGPMDDIGEWELVLKKVS